MYVLNVYSVYYILFIIHIYVCSAGRWETQRTTKTTLLLNRMPFHLFCQLPIPCEPYPCLCILEPSSKPLTTKSDLLLGMSPACLNVDSIPLMAPLRFARCTSGRKLFTEWRNELPIKPGIPTDSSHIFRSPPYEPLG